MASESDSVTCMLEADEPLALNVFNVNIETGVAWDGLSRVNIQICRLADDLHIAFPTDTKV